MGRAEYPTVCMYFSPLTAASYDAPLSTRLVFTSPVRQGGVVDGITSGITKCIYKL